MVKKEIKMLIHLPNGIPDPRDYGINGSSLYVLGQTVGATITAIAGSMDWLVGALIALADILMGLAILGAVWGIGPLRKLYWRGKW
jgi:hypothetical protein